MGKLRVAKRSRGHYAAAVKTKNSTSESLASVNDLERIVLRGQKPSTDANLSSTPTTPEPIPEEFRGQDVVHLTNKTKQVQTKKERRAERREKWMKKLANFQPVDKKAVQKSAPPKITDMHSLIEALPSLPSQLEVQEKKSKCKRGTKNIKRSLVAEVDHFMQVLEHPAFKDDPLATINLHLQNARKRDLI